MQHHHHPWNSAAATAATAVMTHATTAVTAAAAHHYADHTAATHHHHTAAVPAPPTTVSNGPAVSADEVGAAFAFQYFKIMKTRPDDLFRFYNNDSKVSRGTPGANGSVDVRHAAGPSRIRDLLYKEHSCGTRLALAIINNIEAQDSASGAVIVQITGTLKFVDDSARDFVMSAFLVQQENASASGYYVLNDILIFQQQQQQQPQVDTNSTANPQQLSGDKPQQRRISKPNFTQPQQTRLTQEPIDPVHPPVAPSAQPAAAPLPTTTAPQLSGATNTPTAATTLLMNDEASFITPASPALSSSRAEMTPAVEQESLEGSAVDEVQDEETVKGMETPQDDGSRQSSHGEEMGEEVEEHLEKEHEEKEETKNKVEEPQQGNAQSVVETPVAEKVEAATPVVAAPKEKKSVWKKPVTSVAAPEGFDEIASTTPTEKTKPQHQVSGKSTDAATSSSSSSSSSKPFNPVDASRYSESSYAAKLLRSGPGGLRAPCQTGFAVPPVNESKSGPASDDRRNDRRQIPSYRHRPGRGKTLWVSLIPADMTDERVSHAVADQLRGQSCEGHVVRIERIPNQQHGYIELDTEMCAKLLLEKGLHLQGRAVTVDFPNRNQTLRRPAPRNSEDGADETNRPQQHMPQQRRSFFNNRRDGPPTNGHQNNNANNSNNNTSNNSNNASSQNSQDNEEGWTSASRRRPQQQQGQGQGQQQQRFQPNNGNFQNRRQNNGNDYNKNYNNNYTNNRGPRPQQGGRQQGNQQGNQQGSQQQGNERQQQKNTNAQA